MFRRDMIEFKANAARNGLLAYSVVTPSSSVCGLIEGRLQALGVKGWH